MINANIDVKQRKSIMVLQVMKKEMHGYLRISAKCFVSIFLALLPIEAWAYQDVCPSSHRQSLYDSADAVVLARYVGQRRDSEMKMRVEFEVMRSWKTEISGLLTMRDKGRIGKKIGKHRLTILYLRREENGEFTRLKCHGQISMPMKPSDDEENDLLLKFALRIQWLEKMSACNCPSRNTEGWYNHADAVVHADVMHIISRAMGKGIEKFAELKVRSSWKAEAPISMIVQTDDDQNRGCGFSVQPENPPDELGYLLFLRRGENGEYSTDFCSGNLEPSEYIVAPAKPIQSPPRAVLGRFIQPRISEELK